MQTAEDILTKLTTHIREHRTLAAIVFTDVVGFSSLMAEDEENTLHLVRRDFRLMRQLCQQFEGKVLKTIGDALLMYFTSAVRAVACAQEIQASLAEAAAKLPQPEVLSHRIGIHLGDVFFNGKDVMGDGVNVAARLQSAAEPGGICMSQTIYNVVKNPLALKSITLVPKKLKNIQESVLVYQIPPIQPISPFNKQPRQSAQASWETSQDSELAIQSSGQWVLLHEHFFEVETYSQNKDGRLTLKIPSNSIRDDAALQSLRPDAQQAQPMKFAYGDDGFLVKVQKVEAVSSDDFRIWTVLLEPIVTQNNNNKLEKSYRGRQRFYSADDIALLKARRILLNDPPKLLSEARLFTPALVEREKIEQLIRQTGTVFSIEDCVLQSLYPRYQERARLFLELARLEAIFLLKASGIVEQVLEFSLGPVEQGKVFVKFRGRRRQVYVNIEPALIEIEGECPLPSD
ncbi:adenylate/guanylate cyclase domain-containing protein [Lyngbya aestuarii]|uniref:adenylate/guanylate cyclase domain-containing protein n=1 Tax=Lyngbya aestuarii TaxID=118322 RepID=UPI00403DFC8F